MTLRHLRLILWSAVGVALVAGSVLLWRASPGGPVLATRPDPGRPLAEGSRWQLLDERNQPFTPADLPGRPTVMVFGFTQCPDVCPTSLSYVANLLRSLGPRGEAIRPLFLTVDPERDTPAVMADYTDLFDPRIHGVTGAPDQMAAALKSLGIFSRKVPQDGGGYTMDHSATILLLDSSGRLRSTLDIHEEAEAAVRKVERLLAGPGAPG